MRMLIAVLFVLGCGAKHESTQPASRDDDANPIERITAKALEAADEPDENDEQEEDPEEPDEQEEEQDDEEDPEEPDEQEEEPMEDPDPEVSTPAPNFNYVEWTAEPPTLGKPKVPGPPYPYLEENSRRGLYDQLRKYRWLMWETERMLDRIAAIELEWVENWEAWEARGGGIAFVREIRRKTDAGDNEPNNVICGRYRSRGSPYLRYPLRSDDRTLEKLARERKQLDATNPLWTVIGYGGNTEEHKKIKRFIHYLGVELRAYGEEKAVAWYKQVQGLWPVYQRTKSREHRATNPAKRWTAPQRRLEIAMPGCYLHLCFSPSLISSRACVDNPLIRLYTSGMELP